MWNLKASRFFLIVPSLLFFSCASSYKPVKLDRFSYFDAQVSNDVEVSYAHNIQYASRNKWYTKKERKFGMIAVAVRVENRSLETIELSPANLRVFGPNGSARRLYTPMEYGEKVKQRTGRHLLHALYGPWVVSWETDASGNVDTNVFFLPVGAVIGIGNAIRASKANRINIETLDRNAIWNKVVDPGEIVYGTLLMAGTHGDDLTFVYRK
ncbi:MAG TPA: hypothetical protein VGD65_04845 [Chryseosolibacter sp.]